MGPLNKRLSYRPKRSFDASITGRRNRRELTIVPVPREELPDEMRSVLESFISSQRPSLADIRLAPPDVQHASTSVRNQSQGSPVSGREGYDYDGIHSPNFNRPFNLTWKGKGFPSRVYHTHKVMPRARPDAKKQFGRRKWHPSKRHGRVIRQEDYDAYAARELGQTTTQFLNSESLLDLSVRGGRTVKGMIGKAAGAGAGGGLWRWPCSWKSKLRKVAKMFRRG